MPSESEHGDANSTKPANEIVCRRAKVKTGDYQGVDYCQCGEGDGCFLCAEKPFEQNSDERAALRLIQERRAYFSSKDLHNGWSGNASGPCCEKCAMLAQHYTGRGDALKALAGCRNPFQMPEICQCHIAVREAVKAGIVEAHDQLVEQLTKTQRLYTTTRAALAISSTERETNFEQERNDLSKEIEACHSLLDQFYSEDPAMTSADTLEQRLKLHLDELRPVITDDDVNGDD